MEAILDILSSYSLSEAQSDSINNVSLAPFYRKLALMASTATSFQVMSLDRQMTGTSLAKWPRIERKLEDFTPEGHIALNRLKEQIRIRLPELSASQGAVVLLDPLTKLFAVDILGGPDKYGEAKDALQAFHRRVYSILHPDKEYENDNVAVDNEEDDPGQRRKLPFNLYAAAPVLTPNKIDKDSAANQVVDEYLSHTIHFNDFLVNGAKLFTSSKLKKLDIVSLIERLDSMKFFCSAGHERFPSITLLARALMSRFSNNSFQERVFSVAGVAMSAKQCSMSFSHLEMRTILAHNKELFKNGVFTSVV